jgi:hypothetical protein
MEAAIRIASLLSLTLGRSILQNSLFHVRLPGVSFHLIERGMYHMQIVIFCIFLFHKFCLIGMWQHFNYQNEDIHRNATALSNSSCGLTNACPLLVT